MIFGLFKRARETKAEARLRISNARSARAEYERSRVMDEVDGMTTLMTAKSHEEARAYHYALDLVRERGPAEAARIAGLVARYVNLLSRG